MHWSVCGFDAIVSVGQKLQFKVANQINGRRQTVQRIAWKQNVHADALRFFIAINDQRGWEIFMVVRGVFTLQVQKFCANREKEMEKLYKVP